LPIAGICMPLPAGDTMTIDGDKSADQLWVTMDEDAAYIKLRDRGSFKISKPMKEFGAMAVERGVSSVVVDLMDCVGMDSTFMGVLAGLAFRLRKKNGGEVYLVNLTPRTRGLLATLGLDQLVQPSMVGHTPERFVSVLNQSERMETLHHEDTSRKETAAMMLEAHENLVNVSPENLPRFKDVLTFLREDLKHAEHEDAS